MTDPKPYTVAEAQYNSDDKRLLATAQAAAEADSLRARLEAQTQHSIALARMIELEAVHEPIQKNREELVDKVLEQRRLLDAAADHGLSLEVALTAAQGEVAVLREALAERLECQDDKVNETPFTIHDGDSYADLVRNERTRKAINAGFAALTSARATADAHDERVRREALEEVRQESRRLLNSEGSHLVDRVVESLIKEPSE